MLLLLLPSVLPEFFHPAPEGLFANDVPDPTAQCLEDLVAAHPRVLSFRRVRDGDSLPPGIVENIFALGVVGTSAPEYIEKYPQRMIRLDVIRVT